MARILFALTLAVLVLSRGADAQQVPPDARWHTLRTENFRVVFAAGLEPLARHVAAVAEAAHGRLAVGLASAPRGTIDIVLGDHADFASGSATTFPVNRIRLQARPPLDEPTIWFYRDWMDLLVTHELAHIFHLDHAGFPGNVLRRVFGRPPVAWPFFPGYSGPRWVIEGLATQIESDYTGAGRVHGSIPEMILRTAVLEDAFDGIDRADGYGPVWPAAHRRYIYGSFFLHHLVERHGDNVNNEIVRATGRALVPPALAFDRIGRKTIDRSFSVAWEDWQAELRTRYAQLADSLRGEGLTTAERLTDAGYAAWHARAAPDGRIAFAAADGRSDAGIRVFDPSTGRTATLSRTNGLPGVSWLRHGQTLLSSQLEFDGPYRIYRDLYMVAADGRARRLTHGGRFAEPDVAPDGRHAVVVQHEHGTSRLVVLDLETGEPRPITRYRPDTHWSLPRWDPAGQRIAAGRWREGGTYEIAVLDTRGNELRSLAHGPAIAGSPAWSPDGRYLLFWSDRDGIPNIYAYDLVPTLARSADADNDEPRLWQVTNVLTGALFPEVSPDSRWIYFSGYRADGYVLERIPYEPETWRTPAPTRVTIEAPNGSRVPGRTVVDDDGGPPVPGADTAAVAPYSPWPDLVPRYWLPRYDDRGAAGRFYGASTSARDATGRHAYAASLDIEPTHTRFAGRLDYLYAGLGNPVIGTRVSRRWRLAGRVELDDQSVHDVLGREDVLELAATALRRRWRSVASVSVGGDFAIDQLVHGPAVQLHKPRTELAGAFARLSFANARRHAFSISPEDGVSISLGSRYRHDLLRRTVTVEETERTLDRSYRELSAAGAAYKSIPLPGFASHVLAVRASALVRHGPGTLSRLAPLGGATGSSRGLVGGVGLASDAIFLPVRGFPAAERVGSRAWTTSVEYRVPLLLPARGYRLLPFFLDRISATAFADAGNAWCSSGQAAATTACHARGQAPLVGAGAELSLDIGLLFGAPARVRAGIGYPVSGPRTNATGYIRLGSAF